MKSVVKYSYVQQDDDQLDSLPDFNPAARAGVRQSVRGVNMEPKLISKEVNYKIQCPKCGSEEDCELTIWAGTNEPDRVHYEIQCGHCGHKDSWFVKNTEIDSHKIKI